MLNLIDALALGNVLKWDEIMWLNYNDVYTKLLMNKEKVLFERKLHKNMKREQEAQNKKR